MQYSAQFKLRLPQELKDWLEKKAKAKYHTMQAEMLGLIAEAKRKDEENGEAQQA
ncbi:Arc family DNA-binding protein [Pseudomonas solani]|uniref:Arc family DNA-binding protein n=1 Tax=Pseudomonas solani TaxID=2731552 RepID=UPI003D6C3C5A